MLDALVTELSDRYGLGARGRELFGLLLGYIYNDRRGGFSGFVESFHLQGYGGLVSSWTVAGEVPRTINATEVGNVFGQGLLNDWGGRLGASRATIAAAIAGVLPRLVAALAPGIDETRARLRDDMPSGEAGRSVFESDTAPRIAPAGDFGVLPGVDGLVARTPATPEHDEDISATPGREPNVHAPRDVLPPFASQSLRREPSIEPAPALDPGEQRLADMAAAMNASAARPPQSDDAPAGAKPDNWRPALHPPRRRGGFGWLVWVLLVLAALGAGGWYAWQQGMLDPYIDQHGLPIQRSVPAG